MRQNNVQSDISVPSSNTLIQQVYAFSFVAFKFHPSRPKFSNDNKQYIGAQRVRVNVSGSRDSC